MEGSVVREIVHGHESVPYSLVSLFRAKGSWRVFRIFLTIAEIRDRLAEVSEGGVCLHPGVVLPYDVQRLVPEDLSHNRVFTRVSAQMYEPRKMPKKMGIHHQANVPEHMLLDLAGKRVHCLCADAIPPWKQCAVFWFGKNWPELLQITYQQYGGFHRQFMLKVEVVLDVLSRDYDVPTIRFPSRAYQVGIQLQLHQVLDT
jgi:hypothetical protein